MTCVMFIYDHDVTHARIMLKALIIGFSWTPRIHVAPVCQLSSTFEKLIIT